MYVNSVNHAISRPSDTTSKRSTKPGEARRGEANATNTYGKMPSRVFYVDVRGGHVLFHIV